MRKYADILAEDEYGRDQGEMYGPDYEPSEYDMPDNEEDFIAWVQGDDREDDRVTGEGFDSGRLEINDNNEVWMDDRRMGKLFAHAGHMMLMYGSYGRGDEDQDSQLIGALKKAPDGIDVYYYQPGYVGTSKDLKSALETLIIAAWS